MKGPTTNDTEKKFHVAAGQPVPCNDGGGSLRIVAPLVALALIAGGIAYQRYEAKQAEFEDIRNQVELKKRREIAAQLAEEQRKNETEQGLNNITMKILPADPRQEEQLKKRMEEARARAEALRSAVKNENSQTPPPADFER